MLDKKKNPAASNLATIRWNKVRKEKTERFTKQIKKVLLDKKELDIGAQTLAEMIVVKKFK